MAKELVLGKKATFYVYGTWEDASGSIVAINASNQSTQFNDAAIFYPNVAVFTLPASWVVSENLPGSLTLKVDGEIVSVVIVVAESGENSVSWSDVTGKPSTFAPATHGHVTNDVTGLDDALADKAETVHTHAQDDVTGLTAALSGKANSSHTHAESDVTGLTAALAGKAASSHSHAQSDVTGLTSALSGKADSSHSHSQSDVTGLSVALSGKMDTGIAGLPAGSTITVYKSGGTWPSRPTTRTDIVVQWVGAAPSPSIVTSPATNGMYEGDLRFVPAS